jgi:hypothetical protein
VLDFLFGSSERELALLYFVYVSSFLLFYYCINTFMYRSYLFPYAIALVPLLVASPGQAQTVLDGAYA